MFLSSKGFKLLIFLIREGLYAHSVYFEYAIPYVRKKWALKYSTDDGKYVIDAVIHESHAHAKHCVSSKIYSYVGSSGVTHPFIIPLTTGCGFDSVTIRKRVNVLEQC
jgi:hypothetical protein